MKKRVFMIFAILFLFAVGGLFYSNEAEAKVTSEQKNEYINVLSQAIREGVESKNIDNYKKLSQGSVGKNCLKQAVLQNRAALMAEGIDFLDTNWTQYYAVNRVKQRTVFTSTKTISRKKYQKRYRKIIKGLNEVLSCVDKSMTNADKAMAVYQYLAKNTVYQSSADCHTGYDVLVNHTGVCDGFANAYALVMNTLDIPCIVVSNYTKNHSWNMVKLDGRWYFCDLTNGIGVGKHDGMVVSYESCLVGTASFLRAHPGYRVQDIYGQGNSDGVNIKTLPLASTDYMGTNTAIKLGITAKTCTFYHDGYWYWISLGNILKKSKLKGNAISNVFIPQNGMYIGWVDQYYGNIYMSLNDSIYCMDYTGSTLTKLRNIEKAEYWQDPASYFWQMAYIGRFFLNSSGKLEYYIADLHSVRKGMKAIPLGNYRGKTNTPYLTAKKLTLQAGYQKTLSVVNAAKNDIGILKWKSSNPSVAKVDRNGCITGKKKGTAVITAILKNTKLKCTVKVTGYTITYQNAGINAVGNMSTASGKKKVVLKEPEKSGYIFCGWYEDKAYRKKIKYIRAGDIKNRVLYAKWEKK